MKYLIVLFLAGRLCMFAAGEPVVISRDGWSYDRAKFRETPEKIATVKAAGRGLWLTGWTEFDIMIPKTGWYELWLGGCSPEWARDVFVDGKAISRLQLSSGHDRLENASPQGVQFKELNVFLESGKHTLRFQRLGFPGVLPGVWELRQADGSPGASIRASVAQSRIGAPGTKITLALQGGATGVAASYDLFWRNEATDENLVAGRVNFSAGAALEEKAVVLSLPVEGLYSLQAKSAGMWLRPSDLKGGYFLSARPKSQPVSDQVVQPFQFAGAFGDGVVLQREKPLPVWGWGAPGESVTVSLAGQTERTTADKNGRWQVTFKPLQAGGGALELKAQSSGGKIIACHDVLVGEVWLLSGQSNMGGPLLGSTGGKTLAEAANRPDVRLAVVYEAQPAAGGVNRVAPVGWRKAVAAGNAEKVFATWNAIPFAFGVDVADALKVPVGLISANRGGTYISTWISRELHERDSSLRAIVDAYRADDEQRVPELVHLVKLSGLLQKWRAECAKATAAGQPLPPAPELTPDIPSGNSPGKFYHSLIEPMGSFAIRGILWYQGESDSSMAEAYARRFPLMIESWRNLWNDSSLPFLYVQIAYGKGDVLIGAPGDTRGAELKDVQLRARTIPHTAMVATNDLMKPGDNVHYPDKIPVGRRLALAALATVYGRDVVYSGPVYQEQKIEEGKIRLAFAFASGGLATKDGAAPGGFTIAGEDREWTKADATIDGETVVVSSPDVPRPVAVRYSWAEQPSGGNLVNRSGLPAPVFRTDNWPLITAGVLWEQKN